MLMLASWLVRGHSSVGRASVLHTEGQRFDPACLHVGRGLHALPQFVCVLSLRREHLI